MFCEQSTIIWNATSHCSIYVMHKNELLVFSKWVYSLKILNDVTALSNKAAKFVILIAEFILMVIISISFYSKVEEWTFRKMETWLPFLSNTKFCETEKFLTSHKHWSLCSGGVFY